MDILEYPAIFQIFPSTTGYDFRGGAIVLRAPESLAFTAGIAAAHGNPSGSMRKYVPAPHLEIGSNSCFRILDNVKMYIIHQ